MNLLFWFVISVLSLKLVKVCNSSFVNEYVTLCCVMSSTQIPNVTNKDRLAEIISWLKSRMASLLMTLGVTSTTVNLPEFHFSERKIFIRVFYRRIWNRNDNFNYHTIHNQGQKRHDTWLRRPFIESDIRGIQLSNTMYVNVLQGHLTIANF